MNTLTDMMERICDTRLMVCRTSVGFCRSGVTPFGGGAAGPSRPDIAHQTRALVVWVGEGWRSKACLANKRRNESEVVGNSSNLVRPSWDHNESIIVSPRFGREEKQVWAKWATVEGCSIYHRSHKRPGHARHLHSFQLLGQTRPQENIQDPCHTIWAKA